MKSTFALLLFLGIAYSVYTNNSQPVSHSHDILKSAQTDSSDVLKWSDILKFAEDGNPEPPRRVEKSEKEWKQILTKEQYQILRQKGTEAPGSSELCYLFEPGIYACAACGTTLFDASSKFQSNTGWPSFTQPVEENVVKYKKDRSFGMVRIEALCNVCDSHLGHVFPDGPEPSGLRYCINAISLEKIDTE